jgi:hypothetical protein
VQLGIASNAGPAREAPVSIGGSTVTVSQASGCTYSINPAGFDAAGIGGSSATAITTAAGCPWTASSNASWISVGTGSGTGPAQVSFTVAANSSPARTGTLTIAGQPFTVNQASLCTWVFVPPNFTIGAGGGNGATLVIVSGPCTWTAASDVDWITITSGTSGTADGVVQFVVAPNNGPARTGSLTIAGQRYEVAQGGR